MWVAKNGRENREGEKGIDDLRWSDGKEIYKKELKTESVKGELHHAFQKQAFTHALLGKQRVNKNTREKESYKVCAVKAS